MIFQTLLVRHNLDVIHIEKNICESIIGTSFNVKGKSKDGLKSRIDLKDMKIRNELYSEMRGMRFYLLAAPHTLTKTKKKFFCEKLAHLSYLIVIAPTLGIVFQ